MGYVRNKYTENLDIEQYVLQKYVYNALLSHLNLQRRTAETTTLKMKLQYAGYLKIYKNKMKNVIYFFYSPVIILIFVSFHLCV